MGRWKAGLSPTYGEDDQGNAIGLGDIMRF
jgi:hypothetical protein